MTEFFLLVLLSFRVSGEGPCLHSIDGVPTTSAFEMLKIFRDFVVQSPPRHRPLVGLDLTEIVSLAFFLLVMMMAAIGGFRSPSPSTDLPKFMTPCLGVLRAIDPHVLSRQEVTGN